MTPSLGLKNVKLDCSVTQVGKIFLLIGKGLNLGDKIS